MMDFRCQRSEYLLHYGGNIGYSVRPDERLVLVICGRENEASRKTILASGRGMENEGPAAPGNGSSLFLNRTNGWKALLEGGKPAGAGDVAQRKQLCKKG